MAELLSIALSLFWSFLGTLLLIGAVGQSVALIVSALRGHPTPPVVSIKRD